MRFGRHTTRCLSAALLALPVGGCHEYVPLREGSATPAGVVRVRLTDVGAVAVAASVGPHATVLEGRLVSHGDTSFVLGVTEVTRSDGSDQTLNGDVVTLGRSSVQEVRVVRTAVVRSVLTGAALVVVAILAAKGLGAGSADGGPRGAGGTQPGQ